MNEKTFEQCYTRLEEIVTKLQQENLNIDTSIELFKEGIELKKKCDEILKNANEQVVEILESSDLENRLEDESN